MGTAGRQKSILNFAASAPGDRPAYKCRINSPGISRKNGAGTVEIRPSQGVPRLFLFEEK
jgi:hypothetical protein